jgi:hypothetical protein
LGPYKINDAEFVRYLGPLILLPPRQEEGWCERVQGNLTYHTQIEGGTKMENENLPDRIETPSEIAPISARANPEELFRQIEYVKEPTIHEQAPGWLTQMTNPSARERAIELEKIKTSAIVARRKLIDGMTDSIQVYVDTHKESLKSVAEFTVTATVTKLRPKLYAESERAITSFFSTFSAAVDEINKIHNLTKEQKEERIRAAYDRAVQVEALAQASFLDNIKTIEEQLHKAVELIGRR